MDFELAERLGLEGIGQWHRVWLKASKEQNTLGIDTGCIMFNVFVNNLDDGIELTIINAQMT